MSRRPGRSTQRAEVLAHHGPGGYEDWHPCLPGSRVRVTLSVDLADLRALARPDWIKAAAQSVARAYDADGELVDDGDVGVAREQGVDEHQLCGPLPTPGIAFITSSMRCDAGVVISASHNPFEDNGIKLFTAGGSKLSDEVEEQLEQELTALGGRATIARGIGSDVEVHALVAD